MKLISYKLRGFTPFKYSRIRNLELNYPEDIQIILGTNGSGKSSYLRTLTPYPISRSFFKEKEDGYREMVLEHDGNVYTLISDYGNKASPHQFIKDSEGNLNDGGTTNVQIELIEAHLGLTRERERLLFGEVSFCSMSPGQVKPFLMKICPLDLGWILDKQKKTSSLLRNIKAELKYLTTRETQLLSELSSDEELKEMQSDKSKYQKEISELISKQSALETRISLYKEEKEKLYKEIDTVSPLSLDDLNTHIANLQRQRERLLKETNDALLDKGKDIPKEEYSKYQSKLEDITRVIEDTVVKLNEVETSLSKTEGETSEQILATITSLKSKITDLEPLVIENPLSPQYTEALDSRLSDLENFVTNFSKINGNRKIWSKRFLEKKRSIYRRITDRVSSVSMQVQGAKDKADGLLRDLNGKWDPSISPCAKEKCILFTIATQRRNERVQSLKDTQAYIEKAERWLRKYTGYVQKRGDDLKYRDIVDKELDKLRELYEFVPGMGRALGKPSDVYQTLSENPYKLYRDASSIVRSSRTTHEYNALQTQLREAETHLSTVDKVSESYKEYLLKDKQTLEKKLVQDRQTYKDCESVCESVKIWKQIEDLKTEHDKHAADLSTIGKLHRNVSELDKKSDELLTVLTEVKSQYDKTMSTLTQIELVLSSQEKILSRYEEEVKSRKTDLETKFKHYSDLEYAQIEMPKKYMNQWLQSLVDQVNRFIAVVWNQPLELVVPNDDKDYKFTAKFKGETIDNLSLCSSAQQDIIDLSMCLALRSPIASTDGVGMRGYPLALDETGRTFDEAHKNNLIDLFTLLIQEGLVSQIYLTSHHAVIHGALANIQTLVLNSDNIVLPANYNQEVKLEYY